MEVDTREQWTDGQKLTQPSGMAYSEKRKPWHSRDFSTAGNSSMPIQRRAHAATSPGGHSAPAAARGKFSHVRRLDATVPHCYQRPKGSCWPKASRKTRAERPLRVPAGLAELNRPNNLNWLFKTSWRNGAQPNSPNPAAPGGGPLEKAANVASCRKRQWCWR